MKILSKTLKNYTRTLGEKNEIDDIMALPLFIQAVLGQQILNPKWTWKRNIFEHIFIVGLIIYVLFGTADVLQEATEITSKGEGYYTLLITLQFLIKYFIFVNNRVAFQNVYLIAKTTVVLIVHKISMKTSIDMKKKLQIIVKMLFVTILIPMAMYISAAILANMEGERVTLSKTTSILMPMTSPYYEIGFFLHAIFLFHMAFSICVIDMWFVVIVFFFCVACDCLLIVLKVEPKGNNETDLAYRIRLTKRLRMFYKYHQEVMRYLNALSDMYKWPTLVLLIGVLFQCCLSMFLMTEKVQWSFVSNLLPPFMELFAYNWFGEQFKTKATELRIALQEFDFLNLQLAAKKSYLIIVRYNTNKDYSVRTAFGKDLSLSTMTDIIRASYQVFALLKTMQH